MKNILVFGHIFVGILIFLNGCATPKKANLVSRATPSKVLKLRSYSEIELKNGLRVLYVPDTALPYFSLVLMIKSGSTQDIKSKAGLASLTAHLIDKGTGTLSAQSIAESFAQIGAEFQASTGQDYTVFSASTLAPNSEKLLSQFSTVLLRPSFKDEEIRRVKDRMVADAISRLDEPAEFASVAWDAYLFKKGSYAMPVGGTPRNIRAINKRDILKFYLKNYRPNNAMIAVVGQITPDLKKQIEEQFESWKSYEVPSHPFVQPEPLSGVQVRLISKPGAVQAQLRLGHLGIKRDNPDFVTLRLANTILGGAFYSRLMHRIRTELGLTYGISSQFDAKKEEGAFEIRTSTKNQSLRSTLDESISILTKVKENGVTDEEIISAKGYLKGLFPQAIETAEGLALQLMMLNFYNVPYDYLNTYLSQLDRLTKEDVNIALKKYIHPENLKVLIYGDEPASIKQLKGYKVEIVSPNRAFENQ